MPSEVPEYPLDKGSYLSPGGDAVGSIMADLASMLIAVDDAKPDDIIQGCLDVAAYALNRCEDAAERKMQLQDAIEFLRTASAFHATCEREEKKEGKKLQ